MADFVPTLKESCASYNREDLNLSGMRTTSDPMDTLVMESKAGIVLSVGERDTDQDEFTETDLGFPVIEPEDPSGTPINSSESTSTTAGSVDGGLSPASGNTEDCEMDDSMSNYSTSVCSVSASPWDQWDCRDFWMDGKDVSLLATMLTVDLSVYKYM